MNYKKTILFIFFLVVTVPYATFYTGSINMIAEASPIAHGSDTAFYFLSVQVDKNNPQYYFSLYGPFGSFYTTFSRQLAFYTTKTDQAYIIFVHYLFTILPLLLGLYLFIHKTTKLKLIENKEGKTSFFPFVFAMSFVLVFMYLFMRRVPLDTNHLASIFIMMSIFSLAQDNFRLKKHFILAWIFWALAFCTHFFAITFAVPMAIYLFLVLLKGEIPFLEIVKKSLRYLGIFAVISFLIYFYLPHWDIKFFIKATKGATASAYDRRNWFLFLLSNYKFLFLFFFNFALSITCFNVIIKKFKQGKTPQTVLTAIFLASIFVVLYIGVSFIFSTALPVIIKRMGIILLPLLITSLLGFSSFFKKRYLAVVYLCCFSAVTLLQHSKDIYISMLLDMFQRHHHRTLSEDYYNRHKANSTLMKVSNYLIQQGFKPPYRFQPYLGMTSRVFPEELHQMQNRKEIIYNRLLISARVQNITSSQNLERQFVLIRSNNKNDQDRFWLKFLSLKNFAQKANCHKKIGLIPNVKRVASRLPDPKYWETIHLENYISPLKHPYEKELLQENYVLYVWRKCP